MDVNENTKWRMVKNLILHAN